MWKNGFERLRPEEIGKTIQRGSGGSGRRGQMLENRQRGNLHIQPLWGPKGHGSEPHGQSYLSCFAIDFSTVLQLSSDETMNFQKERLGCRAYILFCCWWLDSTWAKENGPFSEWGIGMAGGPKWGMASFLQHILEERVYSDIFLRSTMPSPKRENSRRSW